MNWSIIWPVMMTAKYNAGSFEKVSRSQEDMLCTAYIMVQVCHSAHDEERNCQS